MSSTGSDKEKSFGFGFCSYVTNDYINLGALSNTHPPSHSFHQGTWLSSVLRTRGLPGCSQVLARAQDPQDSDGKSPFRAPSGWRQHSRPQRQSHMTKANLGSGVCRVKGPHWETGPPSPHLTLCSAEESPGAQKLPAERQGSPGLTGQTH